MTSNSKNTEPRELSFKEKLQNLFRIEDDVYYLYATYEDPISGKIEDKDRKEIIQKSVKVGYDLANKLVRKTPDKTVAEYIKDNDVELVIEEKQGHGKYVYFGTYETEGPITLYKGNLLKSGRLLEDEEIEWLSVDKVSEIVLAHELFHYFEDVYPDMYTNTKEIKLWKLGPYTHTSKLICPSEIAAMSFAKVFLNLDFNSSAINYLLYSSIDEKAGEAFYHNILELEDKISDKL